MQEELNALSDNHTCDPNPCLPVITPIGFEWAYMVKLKSNGLLDRYKARLVALVNYQEYSSIMMRHLYRSL